MNWNRLYILWMGLLLATCGLRAQQAELRHALESYKEVRTLTADVTQTRHLPALTDDLVSRGHFYYSRPARMSMVFPDARQMLLATGDAFVMVRDGRRQVAKAKGRGGNPFEVLQDVVRHLLADDATADRLTDMADVRLERHGDNCTLTLTPLVGEGKAARRAMYTSCVVTLDLRSARLGSLCIHEPGGGYTRYEFSNYRFDVEVDEAVFSTQTFM